MARLAVPSLAMTKTTGSGSRPLWHRITGYEWKELALIAILVFGLLVGYSFKTYQGDDHGGSAPSLSAGPLEAYSATVAVPQPSDTASSDIAPEPSTPDWLRAALLPALLPADNAAMTEEGMLDRGIVSGGAGARTRLLLRKLAAGKEVRVIPLKLIGHRE